MPEPTSGRTPSPEQVQRGADALAAWVNPTWRIGWAEQAARVVLNAAFTESAWVDLAEAIKKAESEGEPDV